jgi:transposase
MSDATSVLFGLEHEFSVLEVERVDATTVKVIIEQSASAGPCPECGVFSGAVKDRPWMRLKDLPVSGQAVELWWRKRRLICDQALCPRKSFTQVSAAVRPRARVTERLRQRVARAIASGNRAVSEVAGEYGVSWPTAHKALVVAATKWLLEPVRASRLGIDETRFRSIRWMLDRILWERSDPWLTSFVDCSGMGRDRCWGWLLAAPEHVCGSGWVSNPRSSER